MHTKSTHRKPQPQLKKSEARHVAETGKSQSLSRVNELGQGFGSWVCSCRSRQKIPGAEDSSPGQDRKGVQRDKQGPGRAVGDQEAEHDTASETSRSHFREREP